MFFSNAKDAEKLRKGRREPFSLRPLRFLSFFAFFALIFFSECAQVVMPSGGAKDMTPPKVTKYMPDSAATNFKGKEINIVFDEYIQLKDVNNQLIVSPLLDEQPEIKLVKNKILHIEFKKPLKENTTYTMNFGNSIADYNEGNEIDNFQYVFSTGSFIDSLSLIGKVQYAFDHKTEKGVLVMLYDANGSTPLTMTSDSTPYKSQPSYFSKTKPDGTYKINNIRAGKYKMFALRDENRNYKYDEGEVIGFVEQVVEINKNATIDVELFKEVPKKLKLVKTSALGYGHILFVFNQSLLGFNVRPLNISKVPTELSEFSKNNDSLHYWFDGVKTDSLKFEVRVNNKVLDTVDVRLIPKADNDKASRGEKLKLNISCNVTTGQKIDLNKPLLLRFNHPIPNSIEILSDLAKKMKLFQDSNQLSDFGLTETPKNKTDVYLLNLDTIVIPSDFDHSVNDTIFIPGKNLFKENKKYKLFIPPNTFTDIFGIPNDTFKIDLIGQEEKFYGNIKLKLVLPTGKNYVLQFLDAKENVVKEEKVNESKTFKYDYLQPGAYKLKLILDTNKDGKWSEGNYLEKTQAEKVIYYDKPITIRSNWDLELEWKVNE